MIDLRDVYKLFAISNDPLCAYGHTSHSFEYKHSNHLHRLEHSNR